jgi:hypothetical protein
MGKKESKRRLTLVLMFGSRSGWTPAMLELLYVEAKPDMASVARDREDGLK